MPSVSGTIPNVIGGISQQPPAVRLENTAGDLKNAIPSVVSGLRKRPPMHYLGPLDQNASVDDALFFFDRPDEDIKTISIDSSGRVSVFDEKGQAEAVSNQTSSYLANSTSEDIHFFPFGDTVFIANRKVVPAVKSKSEARKNPKRYGTVVVTNTAYDTEYSVSIYFSDGTSARTTYTTHASDPQSTEHIASQLKGNYSGNGTVSTTGNIMLFSFTKDVNRIVATPDNLMRSYTDTIDKFTNLPKEDLSNRIVRVTGDPENTEGAYYVTFNTSTGLWEEDLEYGYQWTLDPATMPHVLKDTGSGSWALSTHTWESPKVGDEDSNPHPTFVGSPIEKMFVVSNRLVFLSDENFIASEQDLFENFYRTTCTTLLPSDRIDVAALSVTGATSKLYHAIDFDEHILLFSDKQQFKFSTEGGISPENLSITPTTGYSCSRRAAPNKLGNNVLFIDDTDNSSWADVREYLVDAIAGVSSSEVVTKQCPELIPTGVTKIVSNPTLSLSLLFTKGNRERVYVYSSYWSDSDRLQSAWSYWEASNTRFVDGHFDGNRVFLVVERSGRLMLTYIDLQETIGGDVDGLEIQLDLRIDQTQVTTIPDVGKTQVSLPYPALDGEDYVAVLTKDGVDKAGTAYLCKSRSGDLVLTVDGVDLTGQSYVIGKKYSFVYELSPIFIRDAGKVPVQDGRLQMRYLSFLFHQTSYFRVEVTPPGRPTYTSVYGGRTLGRVSNIVGDVGVNDGELRVSCSGDASRMVVRVINDGPFNCRFSSIEWEGIWRPKTRRLT